MNAWQEKWNVERLALAEDALRSGVRLRLQIRGDSMLPTLWPGDMVEIVETRPASRRKRWALKRIVRQAAEV